MQNEKNSRQDETTLTQAELSFAQSLEQTLNQALGDGDKVTSIWSRLKPEQRARIAEDYLAKLAGSDPCFDQGHDDCQTTSDRPKDDPLDLGGLGDLGDRNAKELDADFITQSPASSAQQAPTPSGSETPSPQHPPTTTPPSNQYSPPRGYPADFNPLAGFPGLEPSRSGPSPEDVIAGALGGLAPHATPLDVLRGAVPGEHAPNMRQPVPHPPVAPPLEQPAPDDNPQVDYNHQAATSPQDAAHTGPAAPNFWPLWIDQQDSLLKQCLKLMSGNMDDAQDALSEAMVKASTKFEDSMDEIRNHRAWLSRIVHNACIDLHRQNRRKAEYREETHGAADMPPSPMTAPITPSPEESYLAGEKLDQLETALLAMQEKLRKPLLMRCVQDRTYDEIAQALGLSNCAVRKRVQLAREHLRTAGIQ
ncbi:RNA polymerase sigma factor [Thalassospira australica]|uniref:RNA polymerase sigma factor n=1 Tax=Thalassospira australica TaxID=1528106 RepID=UPI00051A421B|nr:RNA polymerase sigma factor [Thalassospira australica]